VQSLAEQQHALKISEHTLIIMCNNKTGYNLYSKMPKPWGPPPTYTAQHPGKFGGPAPTLSWGPLWFHLLTLSLWGPGHTFGKNFEIWVPGNGQILHSGSLVDSCIYVHFTVILYLGPPLTCLKANCTPLAGLDSTCSYDYLWQHSFIFT
jgi:hypothetical protein